MSPFNREHACVIQPRYITLHYVMHNYTALSPNNLAYFISQFPSAPQLPTEIPQELIELLLTHCPDWTSRVEESCWKVFH